MPSEYIPNQDERTCIICGKSYKRGKRVAFKIWEASTVCSLGCRNKRLGIAGSARHVDLPPKTCEACGSQFVRREDEQIDNFRRRRTCSRECFRLNHRKVNRGEAPERWCHDCGVQLERGTNESMATYRRRKSCSVECRKRLIGRPHMQTTVRCSGYGLEWTARLRRQIRQRDGNRCRICGQKRSIRALPVHHIDYDKQHCHPSNLITLCDPCHIKTNFNRPYWQRLLTAMMIEEEAA